MIDEFWLTKQRNRLFDLCEATKKQTKIKKIPKWFGSQQQNTTVAYSVSICTVSNVWKLIMLIEPFSLLWRTKTTLHDTHVMLPLHRQSYTAFAYIRWFSRFNRRIPWCHRPFFVPLSLSSVICLCLLWWSSVHRHWFFNILFCILISIRIDFA